MDAGRVTQAGEDTDGSGVPELCLTGCGRCSAPLIGARPVMRKLATPEAARFQPLGGLANRLIDAN
jgi:hypothetical protein